MGMPDGVKTPLRSPPKRATRPRALSLCVRTGDRGAVDLAGRPLRQLVDDDDLARGHVGRAVRHGVVADPIDGIGCRGFAECEGGDDVLAYDLGRCGDAYRAR